MENIYYLVNKIDSAFKTKKWILFRIQHFTVSVTKIRICKDIVSINDAAVILNVRKEILDFPISCHTDSTIEKEFVNTTFKKYELVPSKDVSIWQKVPENNHCKRCDSGEYIEDYTGTYDTGHRLESYPAPPITYQLTPFDRKFTITTPIINRCIPDGMGGSENLLGVADYATKSFESLTDDELIYISMFFDYIT